MNIKRNYIRRSSSDYIRLYPELFSATSDKMASAGVIDGGGSGSVVDHAPCDACFTRRSHVLNESLSTPCCPLVSCPNPGCTFRPHACKVEDHARGVCLFERVPCDNACNGCAARIRRGDMRRHLIECPAFVVRCSAEWNRWSASPADADNNNNNNGAAGEAAVQIGGAEFDAEEDRRPTGVAADGADDRVILASASAASCLDVALMKRDQRLLDESRKIPLKLKSALRNNINKKHPAAPVEMPLIWTGKADEAVSTLGTGGHEDSSQGSSTDLLLNHHNNDNENNNNDDPSRPSVIPSISLGRLLRFLLSLSADLPDHALLGVETENVAEILLNVEKDADRVEDVAAGVLEDLVVYPKKVAEQLVDAASDLEEWAEDLDDRVAPNLAVAAAELAHFREAAKTTATSTNGAAASSNDDDVVEDATRLSIFDAVSAGVAHLAILGALTSTCAEMRSFAALLRKADKITAGTRPRRIARHLRTNVVTPLKLAAGDYEVDDGGGGGSGGGGGGVEEREEERRGNWNIADEDDDDCEEDIDIREVVVDSFPEDGRPGGLRPINDNDDRGLPPPPPLPPPRHPHDSNLGFGLAGLKKLAAVYATEPVGPNDSNDSNTAVSATSKHPAVFLHDFEKLRGGGERGGKKTNSSSVVRLNKEMLPRSHPKPKSMFTFLCSQDFRRDEFENHSRLAHDVADSGLSGWVERRCPLARLGCPFVVRPLAPCTDSGRVVFDDHLNAFGVKLHDDVLSQQQQQQQPQPQPQQQQQHECLDSLQAMPPEVLEVVFRKLDGFSLNHVSRTCKYFRHVCFGLLEEKGLVSPVWKRISKGSVDASAAWRVSHYRWYFSSNATASRWVLTDDSFKMGEHLSRCAFNEKKEAATPKVKVMPSSAFSYTLWSAKKNTYTKYEATSQSGTKGNFD